MIVSTPQSRRNGSLRTTQEFHFLLFIILVMNVAISPTIAKPTNNEDENLSPPTRSKRSSTGMKEIIDLEETACRPKYDCASQRASSSFKIFEDLDSSFTDYVNENQNTSPISVADLVELPSDKELEDKLNEPFFAAIEQDEDDNTFIKDMKDQCGEDAFVYCAGEKYKSINHTMCRFCGLGEKCPYYLDPYNNQVTGRVVQDQPTIDYILKLHNEVRSKIARGWCDQPKAGCMGPVQWDPELARVAQKWADQCTNVDYNDDLLRKDPWLFHDKHANRKTDEFSNWQGTGQNVARDIAKGEAGKFDAQKLVGHWFNQILYFDSEGVKAFGSGKQCSQGIGYYTQLVWQDTTHVGCGWIQFNYRGFKDYYENFLVCNYGPSANIWDQPVYDIAEETCNCPCIGCDKETGLCPANCNYAVWSSWEEWSECSKSCDGGVRNRERDCQESNFPPKETPAVARLVEAHGSLDLVPLFGNDTTTPVGLRQSEPFGTLDPELCLRGEQENQGECNTEGCPQWTEWGKWSECSASCGGGQQKRARQCRYPNKPLLFADGKCPGEPSETRVCNDAATVPCPKLSEWSPWSECTKTCESGERTKERTCDGSKDENNPCQAVLVEKETCNTQLCPLFNEWSEWTECSATCGGGGQTRERNCYDPNLRLKCDGEPQQTRACNVQPCPNWTQWSDWTTCSATCGGGQRNRQRQCELPDGTIRPDSECGSGSSNEDGICNEDVICPEWTTWSQWSECSVSCGGGEQQRVRSCEVDGQIYTSDNGNPGCPGDASEIQECNDAESVPCPELSEWSEWNQCSVTCGGGDRSRTRECGIPGSNPITSASVSASANPCKQPLFESEKCNNDRCPVYTPWTEWSECSATCNGGNQRRTRQCVPANSRLFCEGESEEERQCNENPCPLWTEWSTWSECSYTCGGGTRQKTRECELPNGDKVEDFLCGMGPATDEEPCNTDKCPELGPWTEWGPCTVTCGGGEKVRTRECGLPQRFRDDNPCQAELSETMVCHPEPCPTLTDWGTWSECSHTCGGGFRQKTRECIGTNENDVAASGVNNDDENPCMEPLEVIEGCNDATCPVWSVWGDWTVCSKTCGGGQRTRYRQCTDPATGQDAFCPGSNEESEECNSQDCPYFTEWTKWTECSQSCGGGTRSKVRECIVSGDEANEVDATNLCDGDTQYQEACNEDVVCPVWSEWTDWGQCTATCGGGTEKRIRDCLLPAARNGNGTNLYGCDGDTWEMRNCNEHNCPTWTEWTDFTKCSKSCGGGRRVKTRECTLPPNIPAPALALFCPGDEKVIEICNTDACPKPTEWSDWGECSVTCGGGLRQKTRECVNFRDSNGNPCNEDLLEEEACNEQPCPAWTEWTEWTPCTKTCDKGRKKRARECLLLTRSDCPGESEELEDCNPEPCPILTEWSEWTDCTQTCSGGSKRRVRDCLNSVSGFDASACKEPLEEQQVCNTNECPEYSEWSEWTTCTADCGGGTKSHIRECLLNGEQIQEDTCDGDSTEQVPCNENVECPMWTEWNSWGDCSVTCGEGTRQRGRECARPVDFNGQLMCDGDTYETGPCESSVPPCPMWSEWSEWSDCSEDCGGGYRTHVRVCGGGNEVDEAGKSQCGFGDFEESEPCNKDIECPEQPMWSEWSEWGGCSKTCGGGSKERVRQCGSSDGVTGCAGPSQGMMFCNLDDCPTDAQWSQWGEWSQCSAPCGGGDRSRRRTCESEASNGYGPPPECPGNELDHEKCNVNPCSFWSEWNEWSSCSSTCGPGVVKRWRDCIRTNLPRGNFPRLGLLVSPCPGVPQESKPCQNQDCPQVPNLGPECQQMGITADFGSFGGRPAQSVADCTWDFFGCTRRRGVWPANKPCCQARFDACCSHVMGTPNGPSHSQSTSRPSSIGQGSNNGGYPPIQEVHTTTRQPTSTTPRPTTTTRTTTVASTSQRPGFDRDGNPVRMIDCIWTYNGCVKRRQKPDSQCKAEFNACSMIAMGMVPQEASSSTTPTTTTTTTTKKPIQDIDLAELPEFLKPPTDSDTNQKPPRPIQDIDLPSNQEVLEFQPGSQDSFQHNDLALNHPEGFGSNEFLSCLLRLHDCEENGITNCRNVQRCKNEGPIFSPIESEGGEQVGSFEPGSGPTDTPDDCKMSFHNCGLTKTENDCRREFSKCSGGSQPDYEICADVAEHPQNYLVPHPEDCTKFYSCQSLGIGKGWIAHLMDCPETTGFDDQLRICNFIRVLPRCQKGESRAFQPYQFLRTFHAKQTRTENRLDQDEPQVGYYSTNNVTYSAQSHGGTLNKSPCLLGIVLSFMVVFASKSLSHML